MKAYAVFDGGGVKGAAFVGCLAAAEQKKIEFVGYGGASAGAMVALLACVGWRAEELRQMFIKEIAYTDLLDESIGQLKDLAESLRRLESSPKLTAISIWYSHSDLIKRVSKELGVNSGKKLTDFLEKKVREKLPNLPKDEPITFSSLRTQGCKSLKILASNVGDRRPHTFSIESDPDVSVIDAVRASACYPFVFTPVTIGGERFVDGGLSCNLPLSSFIQDSEAIDVPTFAFELVSAPPTHGNGAYGIGRYALDMLETAMEASEAFLWDVVVNVHHVPIDIPADIRTFDIDLPESKRQQLYDRGMSDTSAVLNQLAELFGARTTIERIQAQYAPPGLVTRLLSAVARDTATSAGILDVRANIMFPVEGNYLRVVYQFGMDQDGDWGISLSLDGGCAGQAFTTGQIAFADLEAARKANDFLGWKMEQAQLNGVRSDRKAVICLPLFDPRTEDADGHRERVRAVLCVDTSTALVDTKWNEEQDPSYLGLLEWRDALAIVLFGK